MYYCNIYFLIFTGSKSQFETMGNWCIFGYSCDFRVLWFKQTSFIWTTRCWPTSSNIGDSVFTYCDCAKSVSYTHLDVYKRQALTQHALTHSHSFQFHKAKVIHAESNHFKRQFLEMLTIEKNKHLSVNKKTDVQSLSKCYSNLIHSF